jgi:hypothetical protein
MTPIRTQSGVMAASKTARTPPRTATSKAGHRGLVTKGSAMAKIPAGEAGGGGGRPRLPARGGGVLAPLEACGVGDEEGFVYKSFTNGGE